jgi:hypothetical protein
VAREGARLAGRCRRGRGLRLEEPTPVNSDWIGRGDPKLDSRHRRHTAPARREEDGDDFPAALVAGHGLSESMC